MANAIASIPINSESILSSDIPIFHPFLSQTPLNLNCYQHICYKCLILTKNE